MSKQVLSIGQCGMDHVSISRMLQSHFNVQIIQADSEDEAWNLLLQQTFDLVLVNRLFDSDGSPGLALVKRIKSDPSFANTPVMLVSNFAEAQQQAMQAGAEMGFGKAKLQQTETISRLAEHLQPSAD